jgi:small conductance mechanosensitive channel
MHFEAIVAHLKTYALTNGTKIIVALAILIIGAWVAKIIARLTRAAMIRSKVDPTLASFTNHVIYVSLLIFVILAALGKLGIQTTSFIALIGAAGLAVGLALQGSLANLSSGVLLILFRPFHVGDQIKVAGIEGKVLEIQVFTTVLLTADNHRAFVPNSKITGDIIINSSPVPAAGRPFA